MSDHDELPIPDGPDPVDGDDVDALRHEVLRLRDVTLGQRARNDVLEDRIAELEAEFDALARNPVVRTVRAAGGARRRLRRRWGGP